MRQTVKYLGLPAIVSGSLIWTGSSHYKSSTSWPRNDVLLNVQVFHRHGDRAPIDYLSADREKEDKLWTKKMSKQYSPIRYVPRDDDTQQEPYFVTNNGLKLSEVNQWNHLSKKLNGTYIVHKDDNYNINSPYLVSSKDGDEESLKILSSIETWDAAYVRKHNRSHWCGKLTDIGVAQLTNLGAHLRQRYVQELAFLPPTYSNDASVTTPALNTVSKWNQNETCSVYVISTNYNRTIQSADALLSGLYPLQHRAKNATIPIHCDHTRTYMTPNHQCQRWTKQKKIENEQKLQETEDADMVAMKEKICSFYGRPNLQWINVLEALMCRFTHNLDKPPTDVMTEAELQRFADYNSERGCKFCGMDRESLRLTVGVLLHVLTENMSGLENKFVVYSGHDGTIQRLLTAIANGKDFKFPWPDYAANIIFEVWEKDIVSEEEKSNWVMSFKDWIDGKDRARAKYVRVLYDGHVIHWQGEELILVEKLKEMWSDVMVDQDTFWNSQCIC